MGAGGVTTITTNSLRSVLFALLEDEIIKNTMLVSVDIESLSRGLSNHFDMGQGNK